MARTKKDQEMEQTKRIMERLVKTPHKPHKPLHEGKIRMGQPEDFDAESSDDKRKPKRRA